MRVGAGIAFCLVSLLSSTAVRADFEMHYPVIDYREAEIEHNGSTSFDNRSSMNNN